jgi:hypothetical protein
MQQRKTKRDAHEAEQATKKVLREANKAAKTIGKVHKEAERLAWQWQREEDK